MMQVCPTEVDVYEDTLLAFQLLTNSTQDVSDALDPRRPASIQDMSQEIERLAFRQSQPLPPPKP